MLDFTPLHSHQNHFWPSDNKFLDACIPTINTMLRIMISLPEYFDGASELSIPFTCTDANRPGQSMLRLSLRQ